MIAFLFTAGAGLCALLATYFRLISRAEGMRKSRKDMPDGQKHGEKLQDAAAWLAFIATGSALLALGLLPNGEVDDAWRNGVLWVLVGLWVLSTIHILILILFVSDGAGSDDEQDGRDGEAKAASELAAKG